MFVWFLVSDYYQLDELLTPEEKSLRIKIRRFMENEVAPIIPKVCLYLASRFISTYFVFSFDLILHLCFLMLNLLYDSSVGSFDSIGREQNFRSTLFQSWALSVSLEASSRSVCICVRTFCIIIQIDVSGLPDKWLQRT